MRIYFSPLKKYIFGLWKEEKKSVKTICFFPIRNFVIVSRAFFQICLYMCLTILTPDFFTCIFKDYVDAKVVILYRIKNSFFSAFFIFRIVFMNHVIL